MRFVTLSIAFLFVACPKVPDCPDHAVACSKESVVDGGEEEERDGAPLTPVGQACKNLRIIGCAEGFTRKDAVGETRNCTYSMQSAIDKHLTVVPVDCLTNAKTKNDVHKCGPFVACE